MDFFAFICCKNCNVCLKKTKIKEKEAGVGPYLKNIYLRIWSPGVVVMGGDLNSKGLGFESQHWILDGHLHIFVVVKIIKFN